jgi:hypothetical protein
MANNTRNTRVSDDNNVNDVNNGLDQLQVAADDIIILGVDDFVLGKTSVKKMRELQFVFRRAEYNRVCCSTKHWLIALTEILPIIIRFKYARSTWLDIIARCATI